MSHFQRLWASTPSSLEVLAASPPASALHSIQPDSGSTVTCLVLNGVRPQLPNLVGSTPHDLWKWHWGGRNRRLMILEEATSRGRSAPQTPSPCHAGQHAPGISPPHCDTTAGCPRTDVQSHSMSLDLFRPFTASPAEGGSGLTKQVIAPASADQHDAQ